MEVMRPYLSSSFVVMEPENHSNVIFVVDLGAASFDLEMRCACKSVLRQRTLGSELWETDGNTTADGFSLGISGSLAEQKTSQ
jgi:hypothetical protein